MNWKSILFTEEPPKEEVPQTSASPPAAAPPLPISMQTSNIPNFNLAPSPMVSGPLLSTTATIDPQYVEVLRKKLMAAPVAAEQFRRIIEPLCRSIADEATRYRTALEIASAQNIDLPVLMEAYTGMVGILDEEMAKFAAKADQQRQTEVVSREQKAAGVAEAINAKQTEIAGMMSDHDKLQSEAAVHRMKLDTAQGNFAATQTAMKGEIQILINKAQAYLSTGIAQGGAR